MYHRIPPVMYLERVQKSNDFSFCHTLITMLACREINPEASFITENFPKKNLLVKDAFRYLSCLIQTYRTQGRLQKLNLVRKTSIIRTYVVRTTSGRMPNFKFAFSFWNLTSYEFGRWKKSKISFLNFLTGQIFDIYPNFPYIFHFFEKLKVREKSCQKEASGRMFSKFVHKASGLEMENNILQ